MYLSKHNRGTHHLCEDQIEIGGQDNGPQYPYHHTEDPVTIQMAKIVQELHSRKTNLLAENATKEMIAQNERADK